MRNSVTVLTALVVVIFSTVLPGQTEGGPWGEKVTARVDGLACPFCAYGVEKKLERLEGVDSLDIRINEGLVILYSKDSGTIDEKMVNRKIKEGGFTPRGIKRQGLRPKTSENSTQALEKISP